MDKCQRQRITLNTMHGLLSLAVGLITGFGAYYAANHFGVDLPYGSEAAAGVFMTVMTWLVSKSKFQFTEECMHMARGADLRQVSPVKLNKARPVRAAVNPQKVKPAAAAATAELNIGKLFERGRVTVSVEAGENNSKRVVFTTRGLSGSDFKGNNGLRSRLENISGVQWENPKNEQNGTRSMAGSVVSTANEGEIAAKLKLAAEKFA
ncbi:MAG: hypothetical protein IPP97_11495 [Candidatus Obscuribacter sp.]|nr:hypothetical protein [Candidatus Obscuribacter sp.]MBP6349579.1 hypothetical protein [Candidatus Obscuribacter sp.]